MWWMSFSCVGVLCPALFACLSSAKSRQPKLNMMKSMWIVCIALLSVCAGVDAQDKYRGGIVYGAKAAFNIAAPKDWVLDNQSGASQGFPCVLYPKSESWA